MKLSLFAILVMIWGCSSENKGGCTAVSLYELNCPTESSESNSDESGGGGSSSGSDSSSSSSSSTSSSSSSSSTSGGTSPAPSVTSVSPSYGSVSGGDRLTIVGTDMSSASVKLDGDTCNIVTNSATEVVCTTDAHASATVDLSVTTTDGSSTLSGGYHFVNSGAFDTSFDIDGIKTTPSLSNDDPKDMYLDSSGRAVVSGSTLNLGFIRRYLTNGQLDSTFEIDGLLTSSYLNAPHGYGIAPQANGLMVLMGDITNLTLERFTSNGVLDSAFHFDGHNSALGPASANYVDLVVDSQHKLIAGGSLSNHLLFVRILTNGLVDTSFSEDGYLTYDISGGSDNLTQIVVDSSDRIYGLGAAASGSLPIVRLTTNGHLDTTFDLDGLVTVAAVSLSTQYIVLQTDERILAGGIISNNVVIVRFNTNGALDTSFNLDGISSSNIVSSASDGVYGMALQSNGKIVVTGIGGAGSLVARFTTNGQLDTSFSTDGFILTDYDAAGADFGIRLRVQTDGRLFVVFDSIDDVTVARFFP